MDELRKKSTHFAHLWRQEQPDLLKQMFDGASRTRKAAKIQTVLQEAGLFPAPTACLLDIGCSGGFIIKHLSVALGQCVGVDLDMQVDEWLQTGENIFYVRGDGESLPFVSGGFDLVICNHVYEHTDHLESLAQEIFRVLKPNGVCYFCGPNQYALVEPHYHLPLLSWLPRGWADRYVRLFGRGQGYPERPVSAGKLQRALAAFVIEDYTLRIIRQPARYHVEDILPPNSWKHRLAIWIALRLPFLLPDMIYLLRKPKQN